MTPNPALQRRRRKRRAAGLGDPAVFSVSRQIPPFHTLVWSRGDGPRPGGAPPRRMLLGPIVVAYAASSLPDGPNRPCSDWRSRSGAPVSPRGRPQAPPRCNSRYRSPVPRVKTGSSAKRLRAQHHRRPRRGPSARRSAPDPGLDTAWRGGHGGPPRRIIRPPAPPHAPHEPEDFGPPLDVGLFQGRQLQRMPLIRR